MRDDSTYDRVCHRVKDSSVYIGMVRLCQRIDYLEIMGE